MMVAGIWIRAHASHSSGFRGGSRWSADYPATERNFNNDPAQRLLVVINDNNDIGDDMEWSGQGVYSNNFSNDAYTLATHYIDHGLAR